MKKVGLIIGICILSVAIAFLSLGFKKDTTPHTYYQVYLRDEIIGVIKSKKELDEYINNQNNKFKKKFGVNKIYAPSDLITKKIETYDSNIVSVQEIYKIISEKEPFTIVGYQFNIKSEDKNLTIYTLSEDIFREAVTNTIKAFVNEDAYVSFNENNQVEIETTGTKVENIYVDEDITFKKTNISVAEDIYTDVQSLSRFLLFGENVEQKDYTVKLGDTISDVAFDNQISISEFLISNPNFKNENNLLYPGQIVKIGITDPQLSIVMEEYVVKDQEVTYQTEVQYDSNMIKGDYRIIQEGSNGLERVAQRIKYVNGEISYVEPVSKTELEPVINEVIVKGDKNVSNVGTLKNWAWPTNSGYIISSDYVYRINPITGWRELHAAIDIAGTGMGSPIYAVTNGVVHEVSYRYQDGNYVCINHNNGYYTCYCHMQRQAVAKGQTVTKGQIIGYVGMTGWATGPHVHFEVWVGKPWMGGYRINPWIMYR